MPYKYIGRSTDFKGKTLWEILGNLKNFGVGRIIARNTFERYPEPSFIKIVKVETLPEPETKSIDNLRKVRVHAEKTFRGRKLPQLVKIESTSYKSDYKLIPKDEEASYCKYEGPVVETKIVPRTMAFPPLMRELIIREMRAKGETVTKEPELEILYKQSRESNYRIANEHEKPNVEVVAGLGTPVTPRLYKL